MWLWGENKKSAAAAEKRISRRKNEAKTCPSMDREALRWNWVCVHQLEPPHLSRTLSFHRWLCGTGKFILICYFTEVHTFYKFMMRVLHCRFSRCRRIVYARKSLWSLIVRCHYDGCVFSSSCRYPYHQVNAYTSHKSVCMVKKGGYIVPYVSAEL